MSRACQSDGGIRCRRYSCGEANGRCCQQPDRSAGADCKQPAVMRRLAAVHE